MDGRKKIARRIRELRRLRGLSQEQLAEKSGTGAKYLSRVETGRENPTLDLLLRIAKGLNVEPYELLAFEKGTPRELRKRLNALIAEARDEDLQRLLKIVEGFLHSE